MSTYVSNRNGGGQTDEQGHYRFQTKVWVGNVLSGFKVKQNSPLARNVLVPLGDIKIDYGEYSYTAWNDADVTVAISTADTSNPRLDRIVAYVDRSLTSGGTNNVGYLKFLAVAGTPGAVPVKASDVTVQAAVTAAAGAVASPWVELAVVRVEANATTIPDSKITDTRVMLSLPATIMPDIATQNTERVYDYVASGLVITADAPGSTRAASMSAGVAYLNGKRVSIPAVAARVYTASRDVYVDLLDNLDGTYSLVYTDVTTNNASPALAANSMRLGIVVVGASSITSTAASINQGQETKVLPIVSSVPYQVTDSLGNLICPRDPNRTTLGMRYMANPFATASTSNVQATGLTVPVIIPDRGRKIEVSIVTPFIYNLTAGTYSYLNIWEGSVGGGTQLQETLAKSPANGDAFYAEAKRAYTPSAGSKTYNGGFRASGSTANIQSGATTPAYMIIKQV